MLFLLALAILATLLLAFCTGMFLSYFGFMKANFNKTSSAALEKRLFKVKSHLLRYIVQYKGDFVFYFSTSYGWLQCWTNMPAKSSVSKTSTHFSVFLYTTATFSFLSFTDILSYLTQKHRTCPFVLIL